MSDNTKKNLAIALDGELKQVGKWKKASDLLMADGISSDMLIKPSKGEVNSNELLHGQIEDTIVSTFSEHVQKIIVKETKTLNDEQKETKRYWVRQVSSLFNKVRVHLLKAEAEPVEKGAKVILPKFQKVINKLNEAIEIAQSIESPNFDVTDVVKALKLQIARIK
jgi:hypothetical protein